MMMFLTLFFIFLQSYGLVKGKFFYEYSVSIAQHEVEKAKGNVNHVPSELVVTALFAGIFALFSIISFVIFIVNAIKIDPFLYPTIAFIVSVLVISMTNASKKKNDLSTEEGQFLHLIQSKKRHSLKGKLTNLVYLTFFVYMFLVQVNLV